MLQTATSLFIDKYDRVEVHAKDLELRIRSKPGEVYDRSFSIVLPTDPVARVMFLGELEDAAKLLKTGAARSIPQSDPDDPRGRLVRPGEIAAND